MTWRIAISHRTGYRYAGEVRESYNEARMIPVDDARQRRLEARTVVSPTAPLFRYTDYFGTTVAAFDVHVPHRELRVESTSVVETSPPPALPAGIDWATLHGDETRSRFDELLGATAYVDGTTGLAAEIDDLRGARRPIDAALGVTDLVQRRLTYVSGATEVTTTAAQALGSGQGVCQDYAHVTLSLARAVGIPARYVSGYLHPVPDARLGQAVRGESHAWVELWVGEWIGLDPTHNADVGERHVVLGRGRDYADVAPLRGIYAGDHTAVLDVEVELTRLR